MELLKCSICNQPIKFNKRIGTCNVCGSKMHKHCAIPVLCKCGNKNISFELMLTKFEDFKSIFYEFVKIFNSNINPNDDINKLSNEIGIKNDQTLILGSLYDQLIQINEQIDSELNNEIILHGRTLLKLCYFNIFSCGIILICGFLSLLINLGLGICLFIIGISCLLFYCFNVPVFDQQKLYNLAKKNPYMCFPNTLINNLRIRKRDIIRQCWKQFIDIKV